VVQRLGQTQGLPFLEQLDGGIRFFDFRVTFAPSTSGRPDLNGWYGLHGALTLQPALYYLVQLRAWLDAHRGEVVVLWISHHGGPESGASQFPTASLAVKRAFWGEIETLFAGSLFDRSRNSLGTTPFTQLVESNQRLVLIVPDWAEFTNGSPFALHHGDPHDDFDNVL
jgi:hypothetical protein